VRSCRGDCTKSRIQADRKEKERLCATDTDRAYTAQLPRDSLGAAIYSTATCTRKRSFRNSGERTQRAWADEEGSSWSNLLLLRSRPWKALRDLRGAPSKRKGNQRGLSRGLKRRTTWARTHKPSCATECHRQKRPHTSRKMQLDEDRRQKEKKNGLTLLGGGSEKSN